MYIIDNLLVGVGLQFFFYKLHGLPYSGIGGCNMKNSPIKPRSDPIKKYFLTPPHIVVYALQLLLYEKFCKENGKVFWPQEATPRPDFFQTYTKTILFNCSKFHWNWSNGLDFCTHTHTFSFIYEDWTFWINLVAFLRLSGSTFCRFGYIWTKISKYFEKSFLIISIWVPDISSLPQAVLSQNQSTRSLGPMLWNFLHS